MEALGAKNVETGLLSYTLSCVQQVFIGPYTLGSKYIVDPKQRCKL